MRTRTGLNPIPVALAALAFAAPASATTFAPYVDMAGYPPPALAALSHASGVKRITLGFVTAQDGSQCAPTWGGYGSYPAAGAAPYRLGDVRKLRRHGGDVVVSFGGQAGAELASACDSVAALQAAYASVVKAYGAKRLDFDIEGSALEDIAANARRAQALAALQHAHPRLDVSFTLPVLPTGIGADGEAIVTGARSAGVRPGLVNLMAMDYGDSAAPHPQAHMGDYAIQAARAVHRELGRHYRNLSVTPMIGINDVQNEVFTLANARQLRRWARKHHLGGLSMWQLGRDSQCAQPSTSTQLTCSGVAQSKFAFSRALGAGTSPRDAATDEQGAADAAVQAVLPGATGTLGPGDGPGREQLAIRLPGGVAPATPLTQDDAGWRAGLAGAKAGDAIPDLTSATLTEADGTVPSGADWQQQIRLRPGDDARPSLRYYGTVAQAAALAQADDNLSVLRDGLGADYVGGTARVLPLDDADDTRSYAVAITVSVRDLTTLKDHLGDLLLGPTTGLDAATEGTAVEVSDQTGRALGGWAVTQAGSGEEYFDPALGSVTGLTVSLPFRSETGVPATTASEVGGPAPTFVREAGRWLRPHKADGFMPSRLMRRSRSVRIEIRPPACAFSSPRVTTRRTRHAVVITVSFDVVQSEGTMSCGAGIWSAKRVSLGGRLGARTIRDGSFTHPRIRYRAPR